MDPNYKIAIVGTQAATIGFRALGFTQVISEKPEDAREQVIKLRAENDENGKSLYAIIYILEELAIAITNDDWKKWSASALPAVTILPTGIASEGLAANRMKKIVERAVGSDILG